MRCARGDLLTSTVERTFHPGRSELHGITVVVDTADGELWVGRCDDMTDHEVILVGADRHAAGDGDLTAEEYLDRASRFGVFPRHPHVILRRERVRSVRRLGELAG